MRRGLFARVMSQARVPAPASDEYRDSEAKPNGGNEPGRMYYNTFSFGECRGSEAKPNGADNESGAGACTRI